MPIDPLAALTTSSTSHEPAMLSSTTTKLTLAAAAAIVLVSQSVSGAACNPSACAIGQWPVATGVALVCGSNAVTYSSLCELELAQCSQPELQLASQGPCGNSSKCDQACDAHESLICGSDGVTYQNACHFDRAYCKDHALTPVGYGACKKSRSLRDADPKPKYVEGSII